MSEIDKSLIDWLRYECEVFNKGVRGEPGL